MKAIRDYIGTLIDIEPSQLHSASTRPRLPGLTTPCTDPDRLYGASDAAGPAGKKICMSTADVSGRFSDAGEEVVRQGFLHKEGHVRKTWKTRWPPSQLPVLPTTARL